MVHRTGFNRKFLHPNLLAFNPDLRVPYPHFSSDSMNLLTDYQNSRVMLVALLSITLVTISCARVKQLIQPNKQSDKLNAFNYSIPSQLPNSDEIYRPDGTEPLIILLPGSDRIHLNELESPPVDLQTLGEEVRSFADGKSEYEKAVFLSATFDVDATVLNNVLNELRKHEINSVNLLVSSVERRKDKYGNQGTYENTMGDIPAPDRTFRVDIRSKAYGEIPGYESKPNPLTLRVRLHPDRTLDLNNEKYGDDGELASKLEEVFDAREANGVFRENSNEVEKTVLFQIVNDGANSKGPHKYGDLIRVIDALKGAGTSPIVLTDGSSHWQEPRVSDRTIVVGRESTPSPGSKVPSTISGGVLNGKATSLPKPPYPPAARAVRASGAVTVQITVDEDGNVIEARAVSGHPLLRQAAANAAKAAKFEPTILNGKRVRVTGVLVFTFRNGE